jgi:hypothetical protein
MAAKTTDAGLSGEGPVADPLSERVLVHLLQQRPDIHGRVIPGFLSPRRRRRGVFLFYRMPHNQK